MGLLEIKSTYNRLEIKDYAELTKLTQDLVNLILYSRIMGEKTEEKIIHRKLIRLYSSMMKIISVPRGYDLKRSDKGDPSFFEILLDLILKLRSIHDLIHHSQEDVTIRNRDLTLKIEIQARNVSYDVLNDPEHEYNKYLLTVIDKLLSDQKLQEIVEMFSKNYQSFTVYHPNLYDFITFLTELETMQVVPNLSEQDHQL